MVVKSGLEFFTLKSYMPLQRYLLTCQPNSAVLVRTLKGHALDYKPFLNTDIILRKNLLKNKEITFTNVQVVGYNDARTVHIKAC
jgi:hypothetical protein